MARFTLNGQPRELIAPGDTPLLWALRESADLTGPKFGCGIGQCGACTVHLDGEAVRSCVTPLAQVEGREVVTIEGLLADGDHPLERAWVEEQVPQCGYCQPGQIMSAAALLTATPRPTDAEIDQAMAGNICRCGMYGAIRRAIHRASELGEAEEGVEGGRP